MIQLQNTHTTIDATDVKCLREEFVKGRCAVLRELVPQSVLRSIWRRLEVGSWREDAHKDIAVEQTLDQDDGIIHWLHMLVNRRSFLDLVSRITESTPLTTFHGRVYRLMPNSGHFDSWHGDCTCGRVVGMSVNLSQQVYSGGVFQLRHRSTQEMLKEVANIGFGDAAIFQISPTLEHQVTETVGLHGRTAFAGWFLSGPTNHLQSIANTNDVGTSGAPTG